MMTREYHKWYSPIVGKDMELLVFGHSGPAVLFFPTRTARFFDYEDWRIVEAVKDKIEQGRLQLYCVDSLDAESFYAPIEPQARMRRHLQYEQYIVHEVIPLIKHTSKGPGLIAAGCSLGGYHAVNLAFRYPQLFTRVLSMSARFDLTLAADSFPDLLSGYFDDTVYYNMPTRYMPNLKDEKILAQIRKLEICLIIGREDPFLLNNQELSNTLTEKKIPHQLILWDEEAHRPRYWRQMVQLYL